MTSASGLFGGSTHRFEPMDACLRAAECRRRLQSADDGYRVQTTVTTQYNKHGDRECIAHNKHGDREGIAHNKHGDRECIAHNVVNKMKANF